VDIDPPVIQRTVEEAVKAIFDKNKLAGDYVLIVKFTVEPSGQIFEHYDWWWKPA
jgi:hypothetical protein